MTPAYVEDKGKLYEIDDKGERILVRSTESESRAFLRFTNKTSRTLNVWWRDFRGVKHHYLCLGPGAFSDINTYITHPWEFTDVGTNENFVINNCLIYRPPQNLAGMQYRTNWNITVTVRTLKFAAMLVIADRMSSLASVEQLGLPKNLQEDLKQMVQGLINEPEVKEEVQES